MTPDLQCTGWPDGWPVWAGGTGNEWQHCCVCHDLSQLSWLQADLELAACVAAAGFPVMAGIMLAGLSTFGAGYRLYRRSRSSSRAPR